MGKIVTKDTNGGYFDSLEGEVLIEGDCLHIRWPSGFVQRVEVYVEILTRGDLRNGFVVEVECRKAYAKVPVVGGDAKLFLNGFEAQKTKR